MKRWIAALALALAAVSAAAQQTQAAYEPHVKPGAGQALLAQMAGKWDVVKSFFPANGGEPRKTRGKCTQKMVHDGHFLESEFTWLDDKGKPKSTGTGVSGFDPKTNKFTTFWYDSDQVTMSIRQSDGTFDGKTIVLWATSLDPDRPGRRNVARAHLEDGGKVLYHRHYAIDEKGNERMVIELRMTRRK